MSKVISEGNDRDKHIDDFLIQYLDISNPKSFFLFAGAGSGKTSSLIKTLKAVDEKYGYQLRLQGKQVAVITYTNAASEEIEERLRKALLDISLFEVSTIHSFAWKIIQNHTIDIKEWFKIFLPQRIRELELEEAKGRKNTKASLERLEKMVKAKSKLASLDEIKKFRYDPLGENTTKDSLKHSEVIAISTYFIQKKDLFQDILIQKFPIILIDESQDTNKGLIDVLFELEKNKPIFSLGLFGDMMQRIYLDGKENLGQVIPERWERPEKKMNHRSQKRIVDLINKIRFDIDGIQQVPRIEKDKGIVRLFVFPSNSVDKDSLEDKARLKMSALTNDKLWGSRKDVKMLTLEHSMAAIRLGFSNLHKALNIEKYKTSLIDGKLPVLNFFTKNILPLVEAHRKDNKLQISRIITTQSALLSKEILEEKKEEQLVVLQRANLAVQSLLALWKDTTPTLKDIVTNVKDSKLFDIPSPLHLLVATPKNKEEKEVQQEADTPNEEGEEESIDERAKVIEAWEKALECSFDEVEQYNMYVSGESQFATHQGVKGLEFDRVVGVLSDEEARGGLFNYERLFGVEDLSDSDRKNIADNKDYSIPRTKRLFYVICSRAKESLALIAYTKDVERFKNVAVKNKWFEEGEVLFESDLK